MQDCKIACGVTANGYLTVSAIKGVRGHRMGGILTFFETKAKKMNADACLCENYARTGVQFFEILHNLQRPYLTT